MITWGYHGANRLPAHCGVDVIGEGDEAVIVLSELAANPGMSVTNAFEVIATSLVKGLDEIDGRPEHLTWLEHYGPVSYADGVGVDEYTQVRMTWDGERYRNPEWTFLGNTLDVAIGKLAQEAPAAA